MGLKQEKSNVSPPSSLHDGFDPNDPFGTGKLGYLRTEATYDSADGSPDSTLLSPGSLSPTTPMEPFDTTTQTSLCETTEALQMDEVLASLDPDVLDVIVNEVSQSLPSPPMTNETPTKVRKSSEGSDAPSSAASLAISSPVPFDAGAAVSSSQFIFTQFGKDVVSFNAESTANTNTGDIITTR